MRFVVLALLLVGCVEGSSSDEPAIISGVIQKQIPMAIDRQIDVLFVIDNSPAMAQHQAKLEANMRRFVQILKTQQSGLPDLRLGVVTTDLGGEGCVPGDDGKLRGTTGVTGNFIVDLLGPDAQRLHNYDGDLADVFARLSAVGTTGCAHTQPLAAARRAVENTQNRSFFREDAYLAFFFITANDADASTDIADLERFFKSIHDDPSKIIVGGVLGNADADSTMAKFLARFPNRSSKVAMAAEDWSDAFVTVTQLVKTTLGAPCIEGPLLDIDADKPGMQLECSVWYEFPIGGESVPACDASLFGSCWKIEENPQICPASLGVFKIEQARVEIPSGTMLTIECLSR